MTVTRVLTAAMFGSALALSACQPKTDAGAAADSGYVNDPNIPAECNAYLARYHACVTKLSKSNPAVGEQMRTQLAGIQESWKQISAQDALARACTDADNAFKASQTAMGC